MTSPGPTQDLAPAAELDLDFRGRAKRILLLAGPIIGAMLSQNIVNLVDTAMVGQLGSAALGAVGLSSMSHWLAVAFFNGLGAGVQVITARRVGEENPRGAVGALHGALLLILLVVIPFSVTLATQAPALFGLLTSDPRVAELGVPYLQIRLCAGAFVVANVSYRGYWNGIGRSSIYLRTIIVIHTVNVVLNYLFIYGKFGFPELGVTGAGIGSAVAVIVGTLLHTVMAWRHSRRHGFFGRGTLTAGLFGNVIRFSAPTGVQMIFMSGGFVLFYRIAELLGTKQLAVTNVLVNLSLVCILPAMAFGLAATTLVGRALGARQPKLAARYGWDTVLLGCAAMLLLGGTLAAAPGVWLGLLMNDPAAEALGILSLILLGLTQPIDGVGMVLSQTLIGAGAVRSVMLASVLLQWVLFLPAVYVFGVHMKGGLLVLWVGMGLYRALFAVVMVVLFRRGAWAKIKV
ncbi:MAG: MATE family efflux transporter [Proteobacteria bacterium]|nr:MAG: MATE family efflux transporter [Pseudomonadota bacterium]